MRAYYNEHDPKAAAWLRELIKAGVITDGDVDERDIETVDAADLEGFDRCHFFAGIGGWDLALQLAGWPADRPVWTGSCPCQPFSAAGQQKGGADRRHLWPHWARLIRESRPATIFGEQVESAVGHGWLDLVFDNLEGAAYACGAAYLPAASVGAPHARQRVWFVADAQHAKRRPLGLHREDGRDGPDGGREEAHGEPGARRQVRGMADPDRGGTARHAGEDEGAGRQPGPQPHDGGEAGGLADRSSGGRGERGDAARARGGRHADGRESVGGLGLSEGGRCSGTSVRADRDTSERAPEAGQPRRLADCERPGLEGLAGHGDDGDQPGRLDADPARSTPEGGGAGFWDAVEWIPCRDGKYRPVEPGSFPLAHGVPARVGRLRGYGNAIVPEVAAVFIRAYLEVEG